MNVDLKIAAVYDKLLAKIEAVKTIRGEKGDKGDTGPQGPKGKDGKDGKQGADGASGANGKDGVDGKDGEDGVSVTDANVDFDGHLVLKLSNGDEIDAGSVKDINESKGGNTYYTAIARVSNSSADLGNAIAKVITADHTTDNTQILKVTQSAVIKLNETPADRETVLVNCATDERIDIVGLINIVNPSYYNVAEFNVDDFGYASLIVEQKNTTIHLMYVKEFGEWLAI